MKCKQLGVLLQPLAFQNYYCVTNPEQIIRLNPAMVVYSYRF
jgi:hypothetical protein